MKPHRALRGAYLLGLLLAASTLVSCSTSNANDKQLKKQLINEESQARKESAIVKSLESAANSVISEKNRQVEVAAAAAASSASIQPAAEKKQGDSAPAQDSLLSGADEYLQIKPEEVSANEQVSAKELLEVQGEPQQVIAEHKSAVDDELDAHLAQDSISQQESAYRPTYSAAAAPPRQLGVYPPVVRAPPYRPAARGPRSPARLPPSYITLKGKLTGFNSIISQYPHPAPGYPHQGPRHLPRGAAAGYAAFRDFVRAHANKYKSNLSIASVGPQQYHPQQAPSSYGGPPPEAAHPAAPAALPTRGYGQTGYGAASAGGYNAGAAAPSGKTYRSPGATGAGKTKVTVAQAYIPHLSAPASSAGAYGSGQSAVGPYVNPVLAKIYGGHAPQGAGKAEYSKDYGMVIHYPQATVYTEPMTVDQLHKLTGAGISQVLEQLQYNLANGHRDESNTIRAHSKHHLGHGITIHAKEYYAPGKTGHYVPTTAAVLSTAAAGKAATGGAYGEQQMSGAAEQATGGAAAYGAAAAAAAQKPLDLGSGYERVKQAVANSQAKYNSAGGSGKYASVSQEYSAAASGHETGEPLSAITSFLGSELESLYKANSALTKHLEPEIQQAVAKAASYHAKASPLKYTDLGYKSPFSAHGLPLAPVASGPYSVPRPQQHNRYQRGRGQRRSPHGSRHPQRPSAGYSGAQPQQHGARPQGYAQQQQQQQQGYQQNQAYQAAEQALNQQVMQLLHDFQSGDDQYNGKSQPLHATNQGYPHKVMQKYQQQQQQQQQYAMPAYGQQQTGYGAQQQGGYGQQQAAYNNQQLSSYSLQQSSPYAQHEGLELPQGSNDQIGEIADLIESLKGALDLSKPDGAEGSYGSGSGKQHKQEEVRYLASTLGQAPSYALQVPVSGAGGGYDKKPSADSYQQQAAQQSAYGAPTSAGYQVEQQQPTYQMQPEAPSAGYQQQQSGYGAASAQTGGYSSAQQQPQPVAYHQQAAEYQGPASATGYASGAQQQVAAAAAAAAHSAQAAAYQMASTGGYQQASSGSGYQQQQQQQQAAGGYQQPATSGYQQPAASGYQQQPATNGYQQQPSSGYQQVAAEQPASSYSVNEHAQVIDHLVPAVAPQQQPASSGSYESSASGAHQPAHQIGLAAPTDSHYQQAQSLSSFVDSLPTDYQEILRQPALLDGHPNVSHLAIQEGTAASTSHYNTTSAVAAASAPVSAPAAASSASHSSYDVHQPIQHQQQQQQAYEQPQTKTSSSGSSSSSSSSASASQQYSTVKK